MTGRLLCAFFLLIAELRGQFARPIRPVGPRLPQPVSGFNFDLSETFQGQPLLWSYYNGASNEYQQLVDTSATYGGAPSLRISAVTAPSSDLGYAELSVPPSVFRGQTITFSGAIKTSGVSGFASLALQVEGPRDAQVLVNLQPNAPTGNTGWQTFSVTAPLVADATGVLIVVTLHGAGSAWFAGLAVEAGGVPLALPATVPDPAQLAWLKVSAFPFTSLDAGMDDAELAPLQTLVGNARIVGLGEGTHGTSEFFRMKSRIISYLARNMGFTVFAIEANLPEAYQMNDYVLNGNGDPKALLAGMYFWTWNTQEVLDMIQWMRSFNASGQGRIEFLGFDMQYSAVAMNNVATFLAQADPGLMGFLNSNYTVVAQVAELSSPTPAQVTPGMLAAQSVLQILTQNRATYIAKQAAATMDFAIENANIVVQALTLEFNGSSGQYRDAQMAANVEWLASQHPNERIVLWAHDAHINKVDGAMGGALGQDFGSDYLALGMLFHSGSYNAIGGGRLGPNQAAPTVPGSVEYFFHQSGVPQQILDVRLATSESRDASSTWLTGPLWLRTIGAVALPGFYLTPPYAQAFDGIVFFDQTTPSTLLPFPVVISTTLAPAKVSAFYFQNLISTYATASVTWQITSGVLPQGLSLAGDGVLSGTPQSAGTYSFQVTPSYYGTPISSATVQLTVGQ